MPSIISEYVINTECDIDCRCEAARNVIYYFGKGDQLLAGYQRRTDWFDI